VGAALQGGSAAHRWFDLRQGCRYLDASLALPAIRKPPGIRSGDIVGVVAPSGALREERLRAGVQALEGWGMQVVLGDAVLARDGYLAGADEARRADLQRMMDDRTVRAIFCARGGYGSQRIVPLLDFGGLARAPKPVVGYSDATSLLGAVLGAGMSAVHGPMVADDIARGLPTTSTAHLRALLTDPSYRWEFRVPEVIRPGVATGPLVGGCLSVLAATLGTPWAPHTDGTILFLEDVGERPFRLDRLLTHMRQAGMFAHVAGVVFGTMASCPEIDGLGPRDVVRACFAEAPYPVGFGVPAGHPPEPDASGADNMALPLGIRVRLDTDRGSLAALEPAVV
jgi:muramoyltetrapeptide carboxypeptidase